MTYFEESSWDRTCPNCSAELRMTAMSLPDPERYTVYCPYCGEEAESGKAGSTPSCSLQKPGDPSKKKSKD
ncbi:hypothetical protein GYB59_15185 [bacterium]|nr:hypothetical protein [bacterium]